MGKRIFLLLVLVALVVIGYWLFSRPPASSSAQEVAEIKMAEEAGPAMTKNESASESAITPRENTSPPKPKTKVSFSTREIKQIRSEMKVSLAGIYSAQRAFFAEFGRYSTDFNALGYSPEAKEFHYKSGFLRPFYPEGKAASRTEKESGQIHSTEVLVESRGKSDGNGFKFSPEMQEVRLDQAASFCRNGCTASESGFEILSVANLDSDPDLDVWSMDDKKNMVHLQDDLAE